MLNAVSIASRIASTNTDVLVVGDDGAGKTWTLDRIADAARQQGNEILTIAGRDTFVGGAFAPFITTGSRFGFTDVSTATTSEQLVATFASKLGGTTPCLMVDDIDLLSDPGIKVLREILAVSGATMICSAGLLVADWSRQPTPLLDLFTERTPTLVRVAPLAVDELDRLVVDILKGQPDAALLATLSTQSGGNPRVAKALLGAALESGLIGRDDGLWTEVGSLEDAPSAAIALALMGRLSPKEKNAVELLAWSGPLPARELERLVPSKTLELLNKRGRIALTHSPSNADVRVSPPALSRALRQLITDQRRQHFVELAAQALGGENVLNLSAAKVTIHPWAAPSVSFDHETAEFAGLISERGGIQEAAARVQWERTPNVQNACSLLGAMTNDKSSDVIDRIFSTTSFAEDDSLFSRIQFLIYEHQWRNNRGATAAEQEKWIEESRDRLGGSSELLEHIQRAVSLEAEATVITPELVEELAAPTGTDYGDSWSAVIGASLELELCRPDDALERIDAAPDIGEHTWSTVYLEHARTEALLHLGWLSDAERWSRRRGRHYYDELDPVSYQFHILGLARSLTRQRRFREAWNALSDGLGLPTGRAVVIPRAPLFDLAAVIQAGLGNVDLARVMLNEAEARMHPNLPLFRPRIEIARAAVARATGDFDASDAILWEGGLAKAKLGYLATAGECWASLTSIRPEHAAIAEDVVSRIESPAYRAILRVRIAQGSGDADAILDALDGTDEFIPAATVNYILRSVDQLRTQNGLPSLSDEERATVFGSRAPQERHDADVLSARETEIAILARAGLTNREIAHRLFVSVRTVENHMYRVLRKLGLRKRQELSETWRPEM